MSITPAKKVELIQKVIDVVQKPDIEILEGLEILVNAVMNVIDRWESPADREKIADQIKMAFDEHFFTVM